MTYNELIDDILFKIAEYESRNNKKPIGILMNESTKDFMIRSVIKDYEGIVKVETFMGIKIFISNHSGIAQVNLVI
jgi:hypothetical protein